MKILHVVPTYLPSVRYGGPIQSVHGLCKNLVRRGHEVHVFTTNVNGTNDSDVPLGVPVDKEGVKVWYFPSRLLRRIYFSPPMKRELEKQILEFNLLHLHSIFLWPTTMAARLSRRNNVPYIISPRGMLVAELIKRKNQCVKKIWIEVFEKKNFQDASAIHFTTDLERRRAKEFNIFPSNSFIVPNGIDEALLYEHERCESDKLKHVPKEYILFLGRISWEKGIGRLIRALPEIPSIPLVIAGNDEGGFSQSLIKLAKSKGVVDRLVFLGGVGREEKIWLLDQASLMILPSYSENFGIVLLEAMARGCPVLATPEVGLSEAVLKSCCGKVSNGEPLTLAQTVNKMLSDKAGLREMGEKGRKVVKEKFIWPIVAKQMEKSYESIFR